MNKYWYSVLAMCFALTFGIFSFFSENFFRMVTAYALVFVIFMLAEWRDEINYEQRGRKK